MKRQFSSVWERKYDTLETTGVDKMVIGVHVKPLRIRSVRRNAGHINQAATFSVAMPVLEAEKTALKS